MNVSEIAISDLHPYENNPRDNSAAVKPVMESIRKFGFKVPIVIDKDYTIVCGHTRYEAAKRLKMETLPCVIANDLTDAEIKAFRLVDNKTADFAAWDEELLDIELEELQDIEGIDLEPFEFETRGGVMNSQASYIENAENLEKHRESLADKFIIPPFSVFDTAQGYWQSRKNAWISIFKSYEGRDSDLIGGMLDLARRANKNPNISGTSVFDPVLCEVLLNWFCPQGGRVLDPFAGGCVRGLVSVLLGNEYTGVDLSERQIAANIKNYNAIAGHKDLCGNDLSAPHWINGDSAEIDMLVPDSGYDFMLTCPPYADLEVYSDDSRDVSNMDYDHFLAAYRTIIAKTAAKLKDDAYAAIIVGEVRDRRGYYRDFVGDTVQAMRDAGLKYYNECILSNCKGTAALRANLQFTASRKVVKTHQNVLVFIKGSEKHMRDKLKMYDYTLPQEGAE